MTNPLFNWRCYDSDAGILISSRHGMPTLCCAGVSPAAAVPHSTWSDDQWLPGYRRSDWSPMFKQPRHERTIGESRRQGRPIYDDMEVMSRSTSPAARTAGVTRRPRCRTGPRSETGEQRIVTYAERWPQAVPAVQGASSSRPRRARRSTHLPFLTEARRAELRALNIYTAEALAQVDGQELKNLGIARPRPEEEGQGVHRERTARRGPAAGPGRARDHARPRTRCLKRTCAASSRAASRRRSLRSTASSPA